MDKLKQWVALTVIGCLALGAGGWFLLISPKRSDAAELRTQASAEQSATAQLKSQLAMLKAQAKDLPKQQARLAAVAAKIPDNPALPSLIRALTSAADQADVELVSLAPSAPAAVAAPAAAAPVTAASGTVRPRPAGAAAASSSAVGTLQQIGVTVTIVGGYFQVEQFLDRVEGLSRAMKVGGFTLAPGSNPVKPNADTSTSDPGKVLQAVLNTTVYMADGRVATTATVPGK